MVEQSDSCQYLFYDRDGEWTIGVQGGYQVEKDWEWAAFKRGQWVKTNAGSYGYDCVYQRNGGGQA
jgi:hypothetical protein